MLQASRRAILNANYMAKRLEGDFDVLYKVQFISGRRFPRAAPLRSSCCTAASSPFVGAQPS